jgi:hypothetical protein
MPTETAPMNIKSGNAGTARPDPESIMKIGMGFWASQALLTAVHLELFTRLAEQGPMSVAAIKKALGLKCSDRNACDLLDTLVHFGFLHRKGLMADAVYSNGPDAAFFLDKRAPQYIGGILEMAHDRLYGIWGDLARALRTGHRQNEAGEGDELFATLYSDPERLRNFMCAMSGVQMGGFNAFARQFDLTKCKHLLDLGGAAGNLSILLAQHHPQLRCTTFDLPQVQPIAAEAIRHAGLSDRVTAVAGDFFKGNLPKADVITMGNILHSWNEEKKMALIQKAYAALPAGGAMVAIENVIDDDRSANVFGLLMSLNMLIETTDGFDYTYSDFRRWATAAGFKHTSLMHLAGPTSAAIAYK